jgi:hypothetical protein
MAFLDNSGDIILDAVLTDAGRARLAQGDGSFKIVKYAFADDEIDYSKYQNANHANGAHPSGSAYYDINILRTPVLESFTNNAYSIKSKLVSIPRTNLLFLPVMILNQRLNNAKTLNATATQALGSYVITCDKNTDEAFFGTGGTAPVGEANRVGLFRGFDPEQDTGIIVDQGLNTTSISKNQVLDSTLRETQYIVELDNRLGTLATPSGQNVSYNYLDDDNIATYNITTAAAGASMIGNRTATQPSPIDGPRGTFFRFQLRPSLELQTSTFLFQRLGTTGGTWSSGPAGTFSHIDTTVRITGATTGYRIDIPIRFLKKD